MFEEGVVMKQIHDNISAEQVCSLRDCRNKIDLLLERVRLLSGLEKVMMTMYLRNGNSFYQLAMLSGVDQTTIARRIRRITERLIDNEYFRCLSQRNEFTKYELDAAKDYFLYGMSLRQIADKRGWSFYKARERVSRVKEVIGSN